MNDMYLTYKDWEAGASPARVIPDVKAAIRSFVGIGRKSYEEIVAEIQKTNPVMTNDDVIEQIKVVALEADYQPTVVEV
jgi:hypothetical protein